MMWLVVCDGGGGETEYVKFSWLRIGPLYLPVTAGVG